MKLTKIKLEEMANEIIQFLKKHELDNDVCIYYNNKRVHIGSTWDREKKDFIPYEKVEEDMNPLDYFEYANPKHILSMSFEGAFYDVMNGYDSYSDRMQTQFYNILEKYGVYYELGHSWNLSCFPSTIDYDEIEYTPYEREPEPTVIYSHSTSSNIPMELVLIKHMWDKLSSTTQSLGGSCTIGDGFEFKYNGNKYHMVTPNYQGSCIYEHWIDTIKEELKGIGATEIYYSYGHLD